MLDPFQDNKPGKKGMLFLNKTCDVPPVTLPVFRIIYLISTAETGLSKGKKHSQMSPGGSESTDGATLGQRLSQNNICAEVSTWNKSHWQSGRELR